MIAELKVVQVFVWQGPLGTVEFLIPRAEELIAARTTQEPDYHLSWKESLQALALNGLAEEIAIDKAMKSDLSVPVIAATIQGQQILIDGWHRITKQVLDKVATIPCYILTEEETRQCAISGSLDIQ